MEIILLEKIQNVGEIGDMVSVKNGYARNFLIPQKKAMLATAEAKAEVEEKRRQLSEDEGKRLEEATSRAEQSIREISLTRLCGDEGKLYGSVSPVDIAEAMLEAGTKIEKSEITQPDGPIKNVGDFEVDIIFHPEVRFTISIKVEGEKFEDPTVDTSEEEQEEVINNTESDTGETAADSKEDS